MVPKRILFVAEAVTLAHAARLRALASRLDRRRFTPVFAWHPRYNHLLGDLGAEFYPLYSIPTDQFLARLFSTRPVYDYRTIESYVAWDLEIFREAEPDVVVGDFRLSLGTSTPIAGIPYVNIINAHWSPYAQQRFIIPDSPPVRTWGRVFSQMVFDVTRPFFFLSYARDINRLRLKFGQPSCGHDLRKIYCLGDRTLYPDMPEVTPTRHLPPDHRYLGPVTWSPPMPAPDFLTSPRRDKPVVYVVLGSSGNLQVLPRVLAALARLPVRVLASTGGQKGWAPSENLHTADYLPGEAACRAADLMVGNGGVASAQQALVAGIPVIGVPSNMDQFLYMHFIEKAGVGRIVRGERFDAGSFTRVVRRMLGDAEVRQKARALAARARTYDAGKVLNETLEELCVNRHPPRLGTSASLNQTAAPPPPPPASPPSVALARELAEAGHWAPSSGNCQPWHFVWDGEWLRIHIVPQRSNPFLDYINIDIWVALGGVLTNMEVAAAAQGHRLEADILPGHGKNGLVARVRPVPGAPVDVTFARVLFDRCTNRQPHDPRPIPPDVRDRLLSFFAGHPDLRVDWIDAPAERDRVARALSLFYRVLFENRGLLTAFLQWVRWNPTQERRTRDGLSPSSMEIGPVSRRVFRLLTVPWVARVLAPWGFFRFFRWMGARQLLRSAAFGVVTVPVDRRDHMVETGRAVQRLWLEATRLGLALQPLAGLLLLTFRMRFAAGAGLTAGQRGLIGEMLDAVAAVAPSFALRMPVFMFRIGYAPPPTARAPRRPLDEVFTDETLDRARGSEAPPPPPPPLPGPRARTKRRVLFMAEAVTITHVGRMFYLASRLDRDRYEPLLSWDPRYNRLLGPLKDPFYPLYSIPSERFLESLLKAKPVYDFNTLERYVTWDLEIFRESRPDVVVGDYRLSLSVSASLGGIPYVNVVNAHWSPYARARYTVPDSPASRFLPIAVTQPVFNLFRPLFFRAYAREFNRLGGKFGRRSLGNDLRRIYCEGDRTLYPDLPDVVPTWGRPPTHRYLGPVVWSPPLPTLEVLRGGRVKDRKTVYVNLGTSGDAALLPRILRVLARRPVRVIAATGGRALPENPPPNAYVTDFLPGDAACRAADLVIFNGGSAGGHQALLAGVPVLGIPSNLDQHLNMYFIKKAGIGKIVRSDGATEKRLERAIDELLEAERFRRRAEELGERARSHRPGEVLNDVLDGFFADAGPVPSPLPGAPTLGEAPTAVQTSPEPPFLSRELLKEVVEAAVLAPSAGNSQPWNYVWDGRWLSIHLVPDRANPFLNFSNPDTWVNLGVVLANIEVAAAGVGHRRVVDLLPEDARGGLVARVGFVPGAPVDTTFRQAIKDRCTNRRPYDARPVPLPLRDHLRGLTRGSRVRLDWFDAPADVARLSGALAIHNQVIFEHPGIRQSFMEWIRLSRAEERHTRDGLSLDSLELKGVPRWLFRLAAASVMPDLLSPLGYFNLYRWAAARTLRRTAALGFLSVPDNDVRDMIAAGEIFERIWLTATRWGLAFQPLAGAMFVVVRQRSYGGLGLTGPLGRSAERAVRELERCIPDFDARMPVILFRLGYAPPPAARSLRRPLTEVFRDLTASP